MTSRQAAKSISRRMQILVVNPDAGARDLLVRELNGRAGQGEWEVVAAQSPVDALRGFWRQHPDLILISLGTAAEAKATAEVRELVAKIRASEGNRHTGIVVLNERPMDDAALSVECLEIGADDFLKAGWSPPELVARVRAVLRLKAMTDELRSANHKLRQLSMTDELTGLANMRSFNLRFADLLRLCRRGEIGLGVMMLDLDHFKSVNDSTTHLVGSFVISEVGKIIERVGRLAEQDVAARYGGDEFIIAMGARDLEELYDRAEEIRRAIAAMDFERDGSVIRITSSIGIAWAPPKFSGRADDIVREADLMLYRSKHAGRNRATGTVVKYPLEVVSAEPDNQASTAEYDTLSLKYR